MSDYKKYNKGFIEWTETDGEWLNSYLTNFLPYYVHHLDQATRFFWSTINGLSEGKSVGYKPYLFLNDFIATQLDPILQNVDMRKQTLTLLAYQEHYKIFTVEYIQFIRMLQRLSDIPAEDQGLPDHGFLKASRKYWLIQEPSKYLEESYSLMRRYNDFRNKTSHNLVCRIEYKLKDQPLEKFLESHKGINFNSHQGIIYRPKSDENISVKTPVKNIYTFAGGVFVNQFCLDSIEFFRIMIQEFFPAQCAQ